jgi:DNA-binding response OmpR family regulator
MKILIVEDEKILSMVLEEKFKDEAFDTKVAADGEEAMAFAASFSPDIILLDLILPKKDGFEVLKELKSDPKLQDITVIVLSNLGEDDEIKKALSLGAKDYFVKVQHPISEIVEKVKAYLLKAK